jgi:hypothetical protein
VADPLDVAHQLDAVIGGLACDLHSTDPDWFAERLAEFGCERAGAARPEDEGVREACMWFLFDCPLADGRSPVERFAARSGGRSAELLLRSELRVWRVQTVFRAGLYGVLCPLGSGLARVEPARPPIGEPRAGALLVGRSVPLGPQRWALAGRGRIVDGVAAPAFDALLASLEAPAGEFWRVHGGVLARAACSVAAQAAQAAHAPAPAAGAEAGGRARRGELREELTLERIATALRRSRRRAA